MERGGRQEPRVGIVIVNWNGWADTLECLEAVFRIDGWLGTAVVCDNGSTDGSMEMIEGWANGALCVVPESRAVAVAELVFPPIEKPIRFESIDVAAAAQTQTPANCRLLLLRAEENNGFAAANNLAARLLLRGSAIDYLWFVNNDALPRRDSLGRLLEAIAGLRTPVIAGATLVEYSDPTRVQALGGRYGRYTGLNAHLLEGASVDRLRGLPSAVSVDYPMGAAMLVSRSFVDRFGPMCEDYFLYFEEIDWVVRAGWPGSALAVPSSIVYHKGGRSTQAGRAARDRSLKADYYMLRGRLLLARKLSRVAVCFTLLVNLMSVARRIVRPRSGVFANALRATWDGLAGVTGKSGRWPS